MKKLYLINFIFLFLINGLSAQDYQLLRSEGKIPNDFTTLSSETYKQETEQIEDGIKRREKKAQKNFFLENSFRLRELLNSGKVLFNDPVTNYINKVADELLKDNPQLRSEIRIYAVKSPHVNAFATNSGMIFVNLGLLAQLTTEAQLAFILSHEMVHYTHNHVLEGYIETQKIKQSKGMYKKLSVEEKLLAKNNYSKERETEADLEGLEIFLRSNYSTNKIMGVFDVLQYAYLPFDDIKFERSFFETDHLKFPEDYFLETANEIVEPEEGDESKSTHPSINKRREYIFNEIADIDSKGKKDFIVSEEDFLDVRKKARYEIAHLYQQSLNYEKAIYQAYMLLKEDPESLFLQKIIAKSLYALTTYYNEGDKQKVHTAADRIEGESSQLFHLFESMSAKDMNTVTLNYLWDLNKKHPDDLEISLLTDKVFESLVEKHFQNRDKLSSVERNELAKTVQQEEEEDEVDIAKLTKYEKIKHQQKKKKEVEENKEFTYFAFIDKLQDKDFVRKFDEIEESITKKNTKKKETAKERKARIKRETREKQLIKRRGHAHGIDKMVVFNPFYIKLDHRKDQPRKFLKSENAQLGLSERIFKNANLNNLDLEVIDDIVFKENDLEKYNDLAFLNSWFKERLSHLDNQVPITNLDRELVNELISKYDTKYFCWMGILGHTSRKGGKLGNLLLASSLGYLFVPAIPYYLFKMVTPEYATNFYCLVLDIKTGEIVHAQAESIGYMDSSSQINATLYDLFYQIKTNR
ncbi:M48 family metallopeptidase [Cytophagaceae bacterium ABcell3]|nr:M48 family metallopeptidase [Cytophagaceae bacterium ABcell3]